MSYTAPTLDDFVLRFPEFKETPAYKINAAMIEVMRSVDETWIEGDYIPAILYLTAHVLSGDISAAETVGNGGEIASESIGRISISYRQTASGGGAGLLSTSYGTKYAELRRLNHPPFLIV